MRPPLPRRTRTAIFVPLALAGLALGGTGCTSKKNLDASVDRLVRAAAKNDYADFKAMSVPELADQFPPEKFAEFAKALALLGEFKERTMKGIQVKTGGRREGQYALRFSKGTVRLEIKLLRDKLTAFFFTGDDLMKALRQVRSEKYAQYQLTGFQWRDAEDKPASNIYALGKPIHFRVEVWGLALKDKAVSLKADLKVLAGDKTVLDQAGFVDKVLPLPEDKPPMATLTANLTIPAAGTYKLALRVTDKHSQKVITHEEAFVVEPAK